MLNSHTRYLLLILIGLLFKTASAQHRYQGIISGVPWFDYKGAVVSAHAPGVIKDGERYYMFGEKHLDKDNSFAGFSCYSSTDLYNWRFESIALDVQREGKLGPSSVGERAKVMKCPSTGEYVMFMHADTIGHTSQYIGYAVSDHVTGPYQFRGPLLFEGKPIKKWDMGAFQDKDGLGYVLIHGGEIYQLTKDYKSAEKKVAANFAPDSESPAVFHKNGLYYWLGSRLTSWERNDNFYYTATSLKGPWTFRGLFSPEGSLTWNSQTSFVLPIAGSKDTTFIYMGDRWSYPKQASSATYVWQPLIIRGTTLSMPAYEQEWTVDKRSGVMKLRENTATVIQSSNSKVKYFGKWQKDIAIQQDERISNEKDAGFTVSFSGRAVGFKGFARQDGGYAQVDVINKDGKAVISALVDIYAKRKEESLRFYSGILPYGSYKLTVKVIGEHGNWSDKKHNQYGSSDNFISLTKVLITR